MEIQWVERNKQRYANQEETARRNSCGILNMYKRIERKELRSWNCREYGRIYTTSLLYLMKIKDWQNKKNEGELHTKQNIYKSGKQKWGNNEGWNQQKNITKSKTTVSEKQKKLLPFVWSQNKTLSLLSLIHI